MVLCVSSMHAAVTLRLHAASIVGLHAQVYGTAIPSVQPDMSPLAPHPGLPRPSQAGDEELPNGAPRVYQGGTCHELVQYLRGRCGGNQPPQAALMPSH